MPGFRTGRPDLSSGFEPTPDPPTPSGALYIFDARKPYGVIQSLADEERLTGWTNLGSSGINATTDETYGGPLMRTFVTPNSKPALNLNGVTNSFALADKLSFVNQTGIFHMVAVFRKAEALGIHAIISTLNFNQAANPGFWFSLSPSGGLYVYVGRDNLSACVSYNSAFTWAPGTWKALEIAGDGTTFYASQNLTSAYTTQGFANPPNASGVAPFNARVLAFPSAVTTFGYNQGDFAALYIWDRKLTTGERATLATYVSQVWGVT